MNSLNKIRKKIPDTVLIVVAGKNRSIGQLQKIIDDGITIIGENKVQELLYKYPKLKNKVYFDFIGHLQTNKVKYIIDKVRLIHSLDSFKLAQAIDKYAKKIIQVLVEINTTGEKNKFGIPTKNLTDFIKKTSKLKNIKIVGLMTLGKFTKNPESNRKYFQLLASLAKENNLKYLSMGTSQDFEIAIQEGANIIRLGRVIFEN